MSFQIITLDEDLSEEILGEISENFIEDFSHDSKSPSSDSSPASDLNTADNCSHCCDEIETLLSDRQSLKDEELRRKVIQYFVKKYQFNESKLENVIRRLSKKDQCCRSGNVAYVRNVDTGDVWLEYLPHSCKCESCSYCSQMKRKKMFASLMEKIEFYINERGYEVSFLTITYGRVRREELEKAYEDFIRKIRKLYSYRLTKKKIQKWREDSYKELELYLLNIKDKRKREEKKEKHIYLIEKSFQKIWKAFEEGAKYFYEIFPYMFLKIEITCRNSSYHIHAHGVVVNSISRFVWLSLLKQIGFGEIFDIRKVKSVKTVVNYLSKYLLKADAVEFNNLEDEIIYEYTVYGRKKIREWGGKDIEIREDKKGYVEEIVYVLDLKINVSLRKHLSKVTKCLQGLKCVIGEYEFEGEKYFVFVDDKGRFILEERFFKAIEEDILMDRYKVLYKFKRKRRKREDDVELELKLEEEEKKCENLSLFLSF